MEREEEKKEEERGADLHQACAEVQEKATLSKNEEARQVPSEGQVGLSGHWVHTGRTPMLATCNLQRSTQCSGGHPVQERSEPMQPRGKGGKNKKKKKSWRNSRDDLVVMTNSGVRWRRLKKTLRRDDRP